MCEAEEQLRRLSFDDELKHVLRTPNKIKSRGEEFQGWEVNKEEPKISTIDKKQQPYSERARFKVKTSKVRIRADSVRKDSSVIIQNKQNVLNDKSINLRMLKLIDQQILSPQSRKILTPNKAKKKDKEKYENTPTDWKYQTPKTSYRANRQVSLRKLCQSQGITNKIGYLSQKRNKMFDNETFAEESTLNEQPSGFKIPLSAIVYPVLKLNSKKPHRRIQRFHSFVARTVRK